MDIMLEVRFKLNEVACGLVSSGDSTVGMNEEPPIASVRATRVLPDMSSTRSEVTLI